MYFVVDHASIPVHREHGHGGEDSLDGHQTATIFDAEHQVIGVVRIGDEPGVGAGAGRARALAGVTASTKHGLQYESGEHDDGHAEHPEPAGAPHRARHERAMPDVGGQRAPADPRPRVVLHAMVSVRAMVNAVSVHGYLRCLRSKERRPLGRGSDIP